MRKITAKQLAHFYMGMSILTAGIITLTNQIELGFIFGPSSLMVALGWMMYEEGRGRLLFAALYFVTFVAFLLVNYGRLILKGKSRAFQVVLTCDLIVSIAAFLYSFFEVGDPSYILLIGIILSAAFLYYLHVQMGV